MSSPVKPDDYFDSPDGHNTIEKLLSILKPLTLTAAGIATIDVMLYSKPKGYTQILTRSAYMALPIIGIGTTFIIVTNLVGSFRNKDDMYNWAVGGAAAGAVFGAWRKSSVVGWFSAFAFALAAMGKKYAMQNNFEFIPNAPKPMYGGIWSVRHDYSLTREKPKSE